MQAVQSDQTPSETAVGLHVSDCKCGICIQTSPDAQALAELEERNRQAQNAKNAAAVRPTVFEQVAGLVSDALGRSTNTKATAKLAADLAASQTSVPVSDSAKRLVTLGNAIRNVRIALAELINQTGNKSMRFTHLPANGTVANNSHVSDFVGYLAEVDAGIETIAAIKHALAALMSEDPADPDSFAAYWAAVSKRTGLGKLEEAASSAIGRVAESWSNSYSIDDAIEVELQLQAD